MLLWVDARLCMTENASFLAPSRLTYPGISCLHASSADPSTRPEHPRECDAGQPDKQQLPLEQQELQL